MSRNPIKFDEDGLPIPVKKQQAVSFDSDGLPVPIKKKDTTNLNNGGAPTSSPTQSSSKAPSLFGNFGTKDEYIAANPSYKQDDVLQPPKQLAVKDETRLPKPIVGETLDAELANRERYQKTKDDKPSKIIAEMKSNVPESLGGTMTKEKASLGTALAKGFSSVASSTLKSIGVAAKDLDFFNEYEGKKAEDLATYKAGVKIDNWVSDLVGDLSPEDQERFSIKLAQGAGQMAGFVLGGIGGKALKISPLLTTAGLGAAVSGASEYEAAMQAGANPDQASKAFWINAGLGTTEALPIMSAFRKMDKYTGGLATGVLAKKLSSTAGGRLTNEMAGGILYETAQETFVQALSNVAAANTYDTTRKIYDGLLETAGISSIIGGAMTGASIAIRNKREAGGLTKEEDNQLAIAQKFAEEKAEESFNPDKKELTTTTPDNPKVKAITKAKTDIEADLASTDLPKETQDAMQMEVAALDEQLESAKTEAYQQELDVEKATIIKSEIAKNEALLADGNLSEGTKSLIQKQIDTDKEKLSQIKLPEPTTIKETVGNPEEISQPIELSTEPTTTDKGVGEVGSGVGGDVKDTFENREAIEGNLKDLGDNVYYHGSDDISYLNSKEDLNTAENTKNAESKYLNLSPKASVAVSYSIRQQKISEKSGVAAFKLKGNGYTMKDADIKKLKSNADYEAFYDKKKSEGYDYVKVPQDANDIVVLNNNAIEYVGKKLNREAVEQSLSTKEGSGVGGDVELKENNDVEVEGRKAFDIFHKGKQVGTISLEDKGTHYEVSNAKVSTPNKGIGTEAYKQLISTLDKPLISDKILSQGADALWRKLEREGFAKYNEKTKQFETVKAVEQSLKETPQAGSGGVGGDGKKITITGYRNKGSKDVGENGTFYTQSEQDRPTNKKEISFDNALVLTDEQVEQFEGLPNEYLAYEWFPDVDFTKEAKRQGISESGHLMDKMVTEEAIKRGYDGIVYGTNEIVDLRTHPKAVEQSPTKSEPTVKEETSTVSEKENEVSIAEIGDAEYNDFIDKGKVLDLRLNDIARKVKNQEPLSEREKEIFTDKTSEINEIIATQPTNEAKAIEVSIPTEVESTTIKETNKVGEGAEETQKTEAGEPPVVPPVPPITNTERGNEGELKDKGILASMYKSVPESAKGKVEAVGLKYRVQSQAEAKAIATQIVEDNGVDVALEYASNAKLDGDVRSMIYNVSLNKLAQMEVAETDVTKKSEIANKYSDALIEYDETGRDAGRFNSAIFDFYKSPLGMEFYTNKKREKAFKEKQAEYGKSWDDFYEQYKDEPEFAAMVQAEILNEKMKKPGFAKKAADSLRKKADDILKNGITPDWLKADVKDAKTKGIDRKVVDKAIAKALKIIADAIEVGGNIASVVAEQVKRIKDLGVSAKDSEIAKWLYKESGATGMDAKTFEDKVSDRIKSLEDSIAKYKKKLADKEYSEKEQPATNDKIKELEQELKDAKNAYYEARKDFPAYKQKLSEKYLQRMKKKLDGLNERQRRKVVEESFRKLAENGALSQEEFRDIIGNTLGLGKLTPEQATKLRGYVEDINAVDDARMEYVETDGSESSKKKLAEAEKKSLESKNELGNIVYTESNVWDTIRAAMQLTAIGVPTIMKNFAWNFVAQGLIKFPANAVVSLGDAAIAKAANILNLPYSRTTSFMGKEQGAFFRHLREGVIEGSRAVRYGINSKDYFEKGVSTKPIQPIKSGVEFLDWAKGNSNLTFAQGMDKMIKASWVGYYMEGVARGLTFFDKPLRYAAEGGTASRIAKKELGLSDAQAKVFERVPKEFAIKHYMSKGDNLAQATKKAEVIVDRIKEVGDKSVAQQANLLSETINKIGQYAKQKTEESPAGKTLVGAGKVVGAPMALFIKTPANIAWQVFSLINPTVAVAQAGIFSANAYKKYKKGDVTYMRDLDRAKDWMGTAAVGIGMGMLGQFLTGIGVVESGEDEDTKKKERDATKEYSKKFTFNYSKFNRYIQGVPDSKDDEDIRIDLSWFGQVGAMMDMKQRMAELSKDNPDLSTTDKLTEELSQSAKIAISSSVLNSASALSTAFSSYDGFKGFGVNYINTMANIVQPQAFAQDSRAGIDYEYQVKADKFWKQLDNTFTARSSLYRYLTDKYPPSDIGIWGDKIEKGGSKYLRYFGISKDKKNPFAQEIYNDAERTGSLDFLPPSVKNKITKNGESIKLNTEQERYLEEQVGKERKRLVTAYVSGAATIVGYGKYSDIKDDKDKKDALEVIYRQGFNFGKYKFFQKYPQLNHEKTEQEKESDKEESQKRKDLNQDIKSNNPQFY